MTGLLISVRDCDEARMAREGGADFVDVKEPANGPLGAASGMVIAAVVDAMQGQVPVSAACGELLEHSDAMSCLPRGVAFAKLGLSGCREIARWPDELYAAWDQIPTEVGRVAVVYADWQRCEAPHPLQVIEAVAGKGCPYLLIDTYEKRHGDLFKSAKLEEIDTWIARARSLGLAPVIAGSLRRNGLRKVALRWAPAIVAVRGAACAAGDRGGVIQQERVRSLRLTLEATANSRCVP